jgi:hypothetical protein
MRRLSVAPLLPCTASNWFGQANAPLGNLRQHVVHLESSANAYASDGCSRVHGRLNPQVSFVRDRRSCGQMREAAWTATRIPSYHKAGHP